MSRTPRFTLSALAAALLASPAALADSHESPVMDFFSGTEIDGWVAGSYLHRLAEADDDNLNTTYFSHPDANTFSMDQAWISLDKAPEKGGAGYHLDYVYGKIAEQQGGNEDSGLIYSAYVSYLANNGIQWDAGRLTTLLGAEVLQTTGNFNITRGSVYGLQPITHTGVIASGSVSDEVGLAFGVVNDIYDDTFDDASSSKAVTGQISWASGPTYAGLSFIYEDGTDQAPTNGNCSPDGDCSLGIIDVLVTHDASDDLSLWLNLDYLRSDGDDLATDGTALGIAAAGRLAISEATGVSLRLERIDYEEDFLGAADDLVTWTATGTVDHMVTPHLMVRGELRYDSTDEETIFGFADDMGTFTEDSQLTALIEVIYNFRQ